MELIVHSRDKFNDLVAGSLLCEAELILDANGPDEIETWDSLCHAAMVSSLEEQYAITFEMEEVLSMETIGAVIEHLKNKGIQLS